MKITPLHRRLLSTHLRRVRRGSRKKLSHTKVAILALRAECDVLGDVDLGCVAILTPTGGATCSRAGYDTGLQMLQGNGFYVAIHALLTECDAVLFHQVIDMHQLLSTHPRRVRRKFAIQPKPDWVVVIHAPAQSATIIMTAIDGIAKLLSTHPRRVRQPRSRLLRQGEGCYPRTRAECDARAFLPDSVLYNVVIHAPAQSATARCCDAGCRSHIISREVEGNAQDSFAIYKGSGQNQVRTSRESYVSFCFACVYYTIFKKVKQASNHSVCRGGKGSPPHLLAQHRRGDIVFGPQHLRRYQFLRRTSS